MHLLAADARGHRSTDEDAGSYLLFKPAATTTSNSDYMAMPGVLKTVTADAGASASDLDRSSKLPMSAHAQAVSSTAGLHGSDYIEMATRAAVHAPKVVSETGSKNVPGVSLKKLSTGSRGGDDAGSKSVSEASLRKLSTGSRGGGDEYISMQGRGEDRSYVDMKTVPYRCTGWLQCLTVLHIGCVSLPCMSSELIDCVICDVSCC